MTGRCVVFPTQQTHTLSHAVHAAFINGDAEVNAITAMLRRISVKTCVGLCGRGGPRLVAVPAQMADATGLRRSRGDLLQDFAGRVLHRSGSALTIMNDLRSSPHRPVCLHRDFDGRPDGIALMSISSATRACAP
jgi:hypothetical protein